MNDVTLTIKNLLDAGVSNHNIRHLIGISSPQLNRIISDIGCYDKVQGKGRPRLKVYKLTRSEQCGLIMLQKMGVHFLDIAKILDVDPNSILNFLYDSRVVYGVAYCIICNMPFVWINFEGSRKCDCCRNKIKKMSSSLY